MMTGAPPPDGVAVARIACSRRSASAASSSARVAKRRTSIFGMWLAPDRSEKVASARGGPGLLGDPHLDVELAAASLIAQCEHRAGLAAGYAGIGALGGGHGDAVDREQQIPRLEAGLLPRTSHVQIGDYHAAMSQAELLRFGVGNILGDYPDPAADDASVLDDVV